MEIQQPWWKWTIHCGVVLHVCMYAIDRVNGRIYAITIGGWLAILERLVLFPLQVQIGLRCQSMIVEPGPLLSYLYITMHLLQWYRSIMLNQWILNKGWNIQASMHKIL